MAVMKLDPSVRSAMALALIAAFDGGSGACTLRFYTGAQPAGPATAITTQVLLGTLTCSDPIATQSNGVVTLSAIVQDNSADADGTATWARLVDGDGVARGDFDVTNLGGSGVIKLNTTTIKEGGPIRVESFTFTIGGA